DVGPHDPDGPRRAQQREDGRPHRQARAGAVAPGARSIMKSMSEASTGSPPAAPPPMTYARVGRSGLLLPRISLGLWQNFGDDRALDDMRDILWRAFELGITHF